jgi:hypothetical protein
MPTFYVYFFRIEGVETIMCENPMKNLDSVCDIVGKEALSWLAPTLHNSAQ